MSNVRGMSSALLFLSLAGCDQFATKAEKAAPCAMSTPPTGAASGAEANQKPSVANQAQINQRDISTIVEQMSFQLCTARSNRWIDDEYYRQEMAALRRASFEALGVKSSDPTASAPKAPSEGEAPSDPTLNEM